VGIGRESGVSYAQCLLLDDAQDFFLAGRTVPWWAAGVSIIAARRSRKEEVALYEG